MSKVLTFSRVFPSYHSRKGEPTYFVEKIWKSILDQNIDFANYLYDAAKLLGKYQYADEALYKVDNETPKHHTIRAGHRWKVGDKFSPRVWSGKPYQSKQIIIAPDIEVKKVWDFEIKDKDVLLDEICINCDEISLDTLNSVARNDGLNLTDLMDWFKWPKPTGEMQIICWNEKINY
jgi:hypothetical protein